MLDHIAENACLRYLAQMYTCLLLSIHQVLTGIDDF